MDEIMQEPAKEAPSAASSELMKRFRSRETAPELKIRKILHGRGLRFRLHQAVPGLPRRTIDICFPRDRVAVFVDGCFWHGCPEHGKRPKTNSEWWNWKLDKNVARDRETDAQLERLDWVVIRFWEHEGPEQAAHRISTVLDQVKLARRPSEGQSGSAEHLQ